MTILIEICLNNNIVVLNQCTQLSEKSEMLLIKLSSASEIAPKFGAYSGTYSPDVT